MGLEYCIHVPNKGFVEYIGRGGVTYARSIGKAMCYSCRQAAKSLLECLSPKSVLIEVKQQMERTNGGHEVYCNGKAIAWNREAIDVESLSDRDLLEELCRRVIDYHVTSLKFHNPERGTPDEVMENDNNYCRVREVVKHVMGIDLECVEEVKN